MRRELQAGLLLVALFGILNAFTSNYELLKGLLIGSAILLMLIGGMRESAYNKVKQFKKKMMMK